MKAIDYIYKNLTRLNKPILTQLLAKESVELTDEMWAYFRETPYNTNPVFLKEMGIDIEKSKEGGEDEDIVLYDITIITDWSEEDGYAIGSFDTTLDATQFFQTLNIILDGVEYKEVPGYGSNAAIKYGSEYPYQYPDFAEYPFNFVIIYDIGIIHLITVEAGEHTLVVTSKKQ